MRPLPKLAFLSNSWFMKRIGLLVFSLVGTLATTGTAHADNLPINAISTITSQIPNIGQIWKGDIPISINFPSDAYSGTLEFPIQGILPYKVLADKANGVEVDFEIWSPAGKKLTSTTIYSFSWNPVGPNTLVDLPLYPDNSLYGTQTMIIKTIYTTSTTGLLSRYLEDDQTIPIQISKTIPPKAPDSPTQLTATQGAAVGFAFSFIAPTANPPVTKYEITIASLLSPNLNPASSLSFGSKTILNTSTTSTFSVTADDVFRYFASGYATLGTNAVLINVRAVNSVGSSDWSNGVYLTTAQFGLNPYGTPVPSQSNAVVVPQDSPTPKILKIVCTKGKLTKTLKGVTPKCPTGYKKK